MGSKYRWVEDGWEPVDAWKPPQPFFPPPEVLIREFFIYLVDETVQLGCAPKAAVKWWMYIFECLAKGKAAEGWLDDFRWDYYTFLYKKGLFEGFPEEAVLICNSISPR